MLLMGLLNVYCGPLQIIYSFFVPIISFWKEKEAQWKRNAGPLDIMNGPFKCLSGPLWIM